MKSPKSKVHWLGQKKVPQEYRECVLRALRRMAILLNAGRVKPMPMSWLGKSDAAIETLFAKYSLNRLTLFSELTQVVSSQADLMSEIDQAENGFYGKFSFSNPRKVGDGLRVGLELTPAFLKWSYERLFRPRAGDEELQRNNFKDESDFMQDCAANYLLKNFWHNYVHNVLQGLHELNYWKFNGNLTYENDFEADNLATLLLVRSYGLPLTTGGRNSKATRDAIRGVIVRNRCNFVFVERERIRQRHAAKLAVVAKKSPGAKRRGALDAFREHEWYFRRRIGNQLSATLVEDGHSVVRLGVYPTGPVRFGRAGPYRDGTIVVQLNGVSIDTNMAVYVTDPLSNKPNATQQRDTQRRRTDSIVALAAGSFGADMRKRPEIRNYAVSSLQGLGERMGGVQLD